MGTQSVESTVVARTAVVYAEGAAIRLGIARVACVINVDDHEIVVRMKRDGDSSKRCELAAVYAGIKRAIKEGATIISVYTSSPYAVRCIKEWAPKIWDVNGFMTKDHKSVANSDAIGAIRELMADAFNLGIDVDLSCLGPSDPGIAKAKELLVS